MDKHDEDLRHQTDYFYATDTGIRLMLLYRTSLLITILQFEDMIADSANIDVFADTLDQVRANVAWNEKFVQEIENYLMGWM